jgi:hypothetical protein
VTSRDRLTERVLELMRRHRRRHERLVDEHAARARLYPAARLIEVGPLSDPLNHARPTAVQASGARVQRSLSDAEFTR